MTWLYLGFFLIGSAVAQVPSPGQCPDLQTVPDFSIQQYSGKWYEQASFPIRAEAGGRCNIAFYDQIQNGNMSFYHRLIKKNGKPSSVAGFGFADTDVKSKLTIVFTSFPGNIRAPYLVVDTDYTSYGLVYSCSYNSATNKKRETAWILTRQRNPPNSVLEKAYQVADANNISRGLFSRKDQTNCPDVSPGQANKL